MFGALTTLEKVLGAIIRYSDFDDTGFLGVGGRDFAADLPTPAGGAALSSGKSSGARSVTLGGAFSE
jgi:hypothetical protein